jgi:PAS domain S-box-containing protein
MARWRGGQRGLLGPTDAEARRDLGIVSRTVDRTAAVQTLLDETLDGLLAAARDGTVWLCNRRAQELLGCTEADAVGRQLAEVLHGDVGHDARLRVALAEVSAQGEASFETSLGQPTLRVAVSLRAIDSASGPPWLCVRLHDITVLRRLQDELADDVMTRGVLEAAPDAMVVIAGDGVIVLVNAQTERLFGYARDELFGRSIDMLVPERFRERHPTYRRRYTEDAQPRPMGAGLALWGRRKDGTEFPAEISLAPMHMNEGQLVTAAIRDVTERRRTDALRSELAAIVDSSQDAIVGVTLDGLVTSWNRAAERLYGYAAGEVIGGRIDALIPEDRREQEAAVMAQVRRGEEVGHYETQRRRKDGRVIDVSIAISATRDASGRTIGTAKVARDISDRKQAEAALARAKEAAETANRELEAFSYSVAHDLRAPLRGIDGFCQVLLEDYVGRLDEAGVGYLQRVRSSAQRMGHLIEGLLALARVNRSELGDDRVDLSARARACLADLAATEPHRAVEVHVADGLLARGDGRLLGVLVDNLLRNAWKFTSKRDRARIDFGCSERNGVPVYFVRDDGAGFDMRYADKLFGAFQRLHGPREFEGTGIGLATVQRIVQRHGGRAWAEGAVGRGATFYFTLWGGASEERSPKE